MEDVFFVPYNKNNCNHFDSFLKLFTEYLDELFEKNPEGKIPKHAIPRIIHSIEDEIAKYKEWLFLCVKDGVIIGFVFAQIDTKENPMCKREGWGFIREFYIMPTYRKKGYGKQMCLFIEKHIFMHGVSQVYLTANPNTGVPFWKKVGYIDTGRIDDKNQQKIFEKILNLT